MVRCFLCLAFVLTFALDADAGLLRKRGRGACSNGQCGPSTRQAQPVPAPVRASGFTTDAALRRTAGDCGQGGCDR